MDAGDISQIIALVILLILSSIFSSTETALTTVNKIRMRTLSEAGNKKADRVLRVTENQGKMLSAILIGNNVVNLSASSLATSIAIERFGSVGAGIATGILTLLILIFGEIAPKTMATINADQISLWVSGFIEFLMWILTPVIFIVNKLAMGVLLLFRVDPNKSQNAMTEEELRTIVDVGEESGVIETEEKEMIHNLFDFGDSEAKEIMIPRIDMTFVSKDATYQEVIEIFKEDKFTRLPVYEETTDNVVGILNMKDLLLCEDPNTFSIDEIMREPYFTFEHKNTADLFMEMRKSSISLAVVLDEYGVTAGMITLEDLLEEIVGEIQDEFDEERPEVEEKGSKTYSVDGKMLLEDVNDTFELALDTENCDTIGGWVYSQLDYPPKVGQKVQTPAAAFTVEEIDKMRIVRVGIQLLHEPEKIHEELQEEHLEDVK